jgi:hypothetical protein
MGRRSTSTQPTLAKENSMSTQTEITVKEIFDLFVKNFGHNARNYRQEDWSSSDDGWEKKALLHMLYWLHKDTEKITHGEARSVAESKEPELLKNLLADLFLLASNKNKE